jgi:hypothetical protein
MMTIAVETPALVPLVEAWLPRASDASDHPSAATLWVGETRAAEFKTAGIGRVARGVAVWIDGKFDQAVVITPSGRAELDLGARWGAVVPRNATVDVGPLLTASASLLLGRGGIVLIEASMIIDTSGGGWIIVGSPAERSALLHAFVRDGCFYVSDSKVALRMARHQPGLIIGESWHSSSTADSRVQPPLERWKPMAQLRGVLLAQAIVSRTPLPWRSATKDQTFASLMDSSPHLPTDPAMTEPLRELLAVCASRIAITAFVQRSGEHAPGNALRQLANAIDASL